MPSVVSTTRGKRDRSQPSVRVTPNKKAMAVATPDVVPKAVPWWSPGVPKLQQSDDYPGLEVGKGVYGEEYRQILRDTPNTSDCYYCPTNECHCEQVAQLLKQTYANLSAKRIVSVLGKRHLCAKSLEQNFVARLCRQLEVTAKDTFYDLGSGNGSVLFQVAYSTGAKCIGVELDPHNAELSRLAWGIVQPQLAKLAKAQGRTLGSVEIITGNLCEYITEPHFGSMGSNTVVWTANLLMPKSVTLVMATKFQTLAPGTRVACFDDMYPHSRSSARTAYPEIFKLFAMYDYKWPPGAVEWCINEGSWYAYRRTDYLENIGTGLEDEDLASDYQPDQPKVRTLIVQKYKKERVVSQE